MRFINLYIDSIGSKLRVKDQIFEVHVYKGNKFLKIEEFAAPQLKSIRMKRGTSLSVEAIHLAMKYEVDIFMENGFGHPLARIVSPKPGSTTKVLKAQLMASLDSYGLEMVRMWLIQKFTNQQIFLAKTGEHHSADLRKQIKEFVKQGNKQISKLENLRSKDITYLQKSIRGIEGDFGRRYFQLFSALLPKDYRFKSRDRRPAKDPFNAFLNYGYGILYNRIESSLFRAGLSPYIGFLHRDGYQFKSLVFDFIEPYRPEVDKAIYQLFSRKKIKKSFYESVDEGLRINKGGKKAIADAFTNQFEIEKRPYRSKQQTLQYIMLLEAQQLAAKLMRHY